MAVGAIGSTAPGACVTRAQGATAGRETTVKPTLELPPLEIPTRDSLARDMTSFAADAAKLFREAGIRMPPDPVLGNDAEGAVRVRNDHPDREKIERLFKEHPEMQQRYAKISAGSSLLRAAEGYGAFAAEYARLEGNTAAQGALVAAEVARNRTPFFMTLSAQGAEGFFAQNLSA